jgi:mono/diheme cytochrome c family protein
MDRMRGGRMHKTSPMPWGSFKRLSDNDLKAIYRYLKTVKPVNNTSAQTMIPPAEN